MLRGGLALVIINDKMALRAGLKHECRAMSICALIIQRLRPPTDQLDYVRRKLPTDRCRFRDKYF